VLGLYCYINTIPAQHTGSFPAEKRILFADDTLLLSEIPNASSTTSKLVFQM
jgi:hypothetical protein